jgi:hypothetical protein
MSRLLPIAWVGAAALVVFASARVSAAEPFTLLILGTRSPTDVELIRAHVAGFPTVTRFVPTVMSQGHLEFSGTLEGPKEPLITDVRGLSVDRYDVDAHDDGTRGLIITLRKIQGR